MGEMLAYGILEKHLVEGDLIASEAIGIPSPPEFFKSCGMIADYITSAGSLQDCSAESESGLLVAVNA